MEVLLAGNISYVTKEFVDEAFPGDHVLVLRDAEALPCDPRLNSLTAGTSRLLDTLGEGYDFEHVVYFSDYLMPHGDRDGEVDRLRRILKTCVGRDVRLVYVSGPAAFAPVDGPTAATGKSIIAQAAEELVRFYAQKRGFEAKVLRCPYLYVVPPEHDMPFLSHIFDAAEKGLVSFSGAPGSPLSALCADDLARLVPRVFDSWTPEYEVLLVPDVFRHSLEDLGRAVSGLFEGVDVEYGDGPGNHRVDDDGSLRRRYGWFPRYDIIDDLPRARDAWLARMQARQRPLQRLFARLRAQRGLLPAIEVCALWVICELVVSAASSSSQLSVIDYRVVYIVICATAYGLNMGVLAAALACAGLAIEYMNTLGYTFQTLFYDPSNWLPFLAYFLTGAACGYIQLRNSEGMRFQEGENELLRERNSFIERLYRDAVEDKRMFRRQIVGRKDSFGKIYEVTRELDDENPREIYRKCCLIFQDILENDSVAIYRVTGEGSFARLAAACPGAAAEAPRSMLLSDMLDVLAGIDEHGVWVNRGLAEGEPMFSYGVKRGEYLAVLIVLRDCDASQLTLYYENLFKILCGLTETALVRAFEYEDAVKGERTEPGSDVLRRGPFLDELASSFALKDAKMSDHLLLRVSRDGCPWGELCSRALSCIRDSDDAGNLGDGLYLLMRQAGPAELPIIEGRLERSGLAVERVGADDEYALVSGRAAELDAQGLEGPATAQGAAS